MSDLTLPGSIPGLLRGCSPVRDAADPDRLGVVIGTGSTRGILVAWCWDGSTEWRNPESLSLDLTDPTGRAHAAWWLAAQHQGRRTRSNERPEAAAWVLGAFGWGLTTDREPAFGWRGAWPVGLRVGTLPQVLDSLTALNTDDDTTLPDGSHRVDAEALRLVVLHVAGVTP